MGVVQLEIVAPSEQTTAKQSGKGALVSSATVEPTVRTVPLEGAAADASRLPSKSGTAARTAQRIRVTSSPEPASGYATVGVTWDSGQGLADDDVSLSVRTLTDGTWSDWQRMHYDADHAPDPGVEESETRDGTDAVVVGDVDDVQVRATTTTGSTPDGLALDIVDPGEDENLTYEKPAIDTGALPSANTVSAKVELAGSGADVTKKPKIFSRSQWGADERLRDPGSLHYGEIHAGFVHHTVNANNYSKSQVPSLLRGIYAYHTQSRGWSDVGYNFLVDRFGRIWEGRYGGVDRPVVGAHTLGYNDDAFAMSAIGNFETVQPSQSLLNAYAKLFAWKLSLSGISAGDAKQKVAGSTFRAINGHRDAGQTACPGRYLYAKIPEIRTAAAALQRPWGGRERTADISGTDWPDLVARDKASKHVTVIRTGGQMKFTKSIVGAEGWQNIDLIAAAGDLDGDKIADVVARVKGSGESRLYPGGSDGSLRSVSTTYSRFAGLDLLTGVGDFDRDGNDDLVGRIASNNSLVLYPGKGDGSFGATKKLSGGWGEYDLVSGVDDLDGDGQADLVARSGSTLYLVPGSANGRSVGTRVAIPGDWSGFDLITGRGDATGDGLPDLLARGRSSERTFVYPGNGSGGLEPRIGAFKKFSGMRWLALGGQMAGSKKPDLVALGTAGRVRIYPNSGRKNIGSVVDTGVVAKGINLLVNVGDWNGDGHGDFMTRKKKNGKMLFYAGQGNDVFASPVVAATGWKQVSLIAAVGDVDGDGHPDLMGRYQGSSFRLYPSNGGSGFKQSYVLHSAIAGDKLASVGLWNHDGTPDIALRRTDGSLALWRSNGPGGLTTSKVLKGNASGFDWVRGLGDMNGDGRADLVGREKSTGSLWLLRGKSKGFAERRLIGAGFGGYDYGG